MEQLIIYIGIGVIVAMVLSMVIVHLIHAKDSQRSQKMYQQFEKCSNEALQAFQNINPTIHKDECVLTEVYIPDQPKKTTIT